MRIILRTFLLIIIIFVGSLVFYDFKQEDAILINDVEQEAVETAAITIEEEVNEVITIDNNSIFQLMGKESEQLVAMLGEPSRKDPSYFDYEWWIYPLSNQEYYQIGILNNKICTLYAIGNLAKVAPFQIGEEINQLFNKAPIFSELIIENKFGTYRFELSEDQYYSKPIIHLGDYYAQIYIDRFTGLISSIRVLDDITLIKQRPYEMVYLGELMESQIVMEESKKAINDAIEQQIFDITNVIRSSHDTPLVEWDEKLASVAFNHSIDMKENNNFSHSSLKNGELKDRLEKVEIPFIIAGENIAADYIDSIEVVEGWLNSKGHRESLLNSEFTHLGVGVFDNYYTQNFIKKWEIN